MQIQRDITNLDKVSTKSLLIDLPYSTSKELKRNRIKLGVFRDCLVSANTQKEREIWANTIINLEEQNDLLLYSIANQMLGFKDDDRSHFVNQPELDWSGTRLIITLWGDLSENLIGKKVH